MKVNVICLDVLLTVSTFVIQELFVRESNMIHTFMDKSKLMVLCSHIYIYIEREREREGGRERERYGSVRLITQATPTTYDVFMEADNCRLCSTLKSDS